MTAAERMATARRALERAEAAAGLRTRLAAPVRLVDDGAGWGAGPVAGHTGSGTGRSVTGDGRVLEPVGDLDDDGARPVADTLRPVVEGSAGPVAVGGTVADHLPVPAALAGFFPPAGLRRGSVVQAGGSSSLLLALLAAAQGEGWVALAALPDIGLQAAADAGLSLERSLLVPRPGPEAASVVGALVDGVDVLAVGDCRALSARDRRLLSARLRSRGAVLLSTAHWPGADVVLRAGETRTEGLGRGWGRVAAGEMTVHGRGRNGIAGRVRVRLGAGGLGALDDDAPGLGATGTAPAVAAPTVPVVAGQAVAGPAAPGPAAPLPAGPVPAVVDPVRSPLQAVS